MQEARHVGAVASLGTVGLLAFPQPAQALEGFVIPSFMRDTPAALFAVGAVAGFAVVGVTCATVDACHKRKTTPSGKHFAATVAEAKKSFAEQDTATLARGARHMDLESEISVPLMGAHARTGRHFAKQETVEEPETLAKRIPSPEITDYENIAQRYVVEEVTEKKKATRARGVAAVLLERMDMRPGFPVIERGASQLDTSEMWWEDFEAISPNVTATAAPEPMLPELTLEEKRALARENAAKRKAAERISRAVAQVDQGMYPELRTVDELDEGDDLWFAALAAMDDRLPQPVFFDTVGNADTIDEPDNLEPPTEFLTFRAKGARTELYGTSEFVDYLVHDELSRSASSTLRTRSTGYLKVIEGGTQSTARLGRHSRAVRELNTSTSGKHFAKVAEA